MDWYRLAVLDTYAKNIAERDNPATDPYERKRLANMIADTERRCPWVLDG